eukprot:10178488-Prorocentrum_lima.AAC.1
MSRADIAPFIGHVQRHAHKPQNKHLKVINRVLRFCKRVKNWHVIQEGCCMVVVADAAYKSSEDRTDYLALRGLLALLVHIATLVVTATCLTLYPS